MLYISRSFWNLSRISLNRISFASPYPRPPVVYLVFSASVFSLEAINEQSIDTASGVSLENASYIENNNESTKISDTPETNNLHTTQDENTPRLFSVDSDALEDTINETSTEKEDQNEKLFDQDNVNEEEEFEIPAFLRKQKF